MPLKPAASSLADSPSTTKLFERLRWLPTESVMPGTAEVSGNSCVLAMLVGDDARREQREIEEVAAVHRQGRDFGFQNGRGDLAARGFDHRRFRGHGDVGLDAGEGQRERQLKRRACGDGEPPCHVREPGQRDGDLVDADAQIRKSEAALASGDRRRDDVGGAGAWPELMAPGMAAPLSSTTRPLMLPTSTVCCAAMGRASVSASANANRKLTRENMNPPKTANRNRNQIGTGRELISRKLRASFWAEERRGVASR